MIPWDNFQHQSFESRKLRLYLVTPDLSIAATSPLPVGTKVLQLNSGCGVPEALDTVLQNSIEQYLTFLDAETFYGSFYLKDMYHALKYSRCKMVGKSGYILSEEDGFILKDERVKDSYLIDVECDLSSAVYDRSLPVRIRKQGDHWYISGENLRWYAHNSQGLIRGRNATSLRHSEQESFRKIIDWMR